MEQIYTPTKDYKVLVRCMTYNQSKYIKDALNGFAMQKTDFPFVCLVVDDASTDGEQEVIKSWMAHECDMTQTDNVEIEKSFVTLVPHKKNANCTFAFYFLKENLYGTGEKTPLIAPWREHCKYEALCEGDDYWINENKLQSQISVLDSDKSLSCCFSKVHSVNRNKELLERTFPGNPTEFKEGVLNLDTFIKEFYYYGRWAIQFSGFAYRLSKLGDIVRIQKEALSKYPFGDIPLMLSCFMVGNGYFIDNEMSRYRELSGGYNSYMVANRDKAIENQNKIKAAMDDIDKYTGYKYHKSFMRNKLVCDYHIECMKFRAKGSNGLFYAKIYPKFWPLLSCKDIIHGIKTLLSRIWK